MPRLTKSKGKKNDRLVEARVTAKEDIVYAVPEKNFCECLSYVALSRGGSLEQIHLTGNYLTQKHFHIPQKMKDAIEKEYLRLRNLPMLP